ncbi:hypothetical protein SCUCBS95973_001601 [Sporothrix curviconia]|uniref:Uncharacterized protein n=1 Tax=Sporothrix curviconia TaxID=1260050 RepID=A0ABP0B064_9PEZI
MDSTSDVPEPTRTDLPLPLANEDAETDEDGMVDGSSSPSEASPPARIYTPPPHIAARFYRTSTQTRRKGSATSSRRNSVSSNHSRSSHGFGFPAGSSSSSGANQSKHVAQHLRRASILADRKARLADRAAHAEQVRLRAALAKAAVRDISVSEERAQAAAQAREKKLEEIAAACAEEVKRAKAVAETMKEKREQNLLRLRQQIKDRLDEAERRREELRRNNAAGRSRSRGQSIPSSRKQVEVMPQVAELKETLSQDASDSASVASRPDSSGNSSSSDSPSHDHETPAPALTPDEAAYKVQNWWRKTYRKRVINDFQQLGLAVDSVRDTSFEEVVELLAQERVMLATGKVLRLCGIEEGRTSPVKEIVVVRAFLSAFLILGHPTQVLSDDEGQAAVTSGQSINYSLTSASARGASTSTTNTSASSSTSPSVSSRERDDLTNPRLQELVGKAKDLLICFETILSRLTLANSYAPPPSLASELVESYDSFHNAFIAWKARDAGALVEVMIAQFVELDAIWQTVKDGTDASVSDTYRESIQKNQLTLMVRIKRLAGPEEGKKKIFDAVRKARKAKAEAKRKAAAATANSNMKPREAMDTSIETAMGSLTGSRTGSDHPNKAAVSGPNCGPSAAIASTSAAGAAPPAAVSVSDAAISGLLPHAKPISETSAEAKLRGLRFGPANEKYSSSPLPENRVIVHELAVNREYRISSSQFRQRQAAWMEPIFHRMRKTMSSENREDQEEHFYYLLTIAETMRASLERLTTPGKKIHQFIGELLDTEVAQRQFAMGSFSYDRFFASIGQLLPKLCAPIRDDEVKELVDNTLHQGNYVDRLQALLSFIDAMQTDHVNFMMSVAAPQLLMSATAYETRRFARLVSGDAEEAVAASDEDAGYASRIATTVSAEEQLPASTTAWRVARGKVLEEAAKRDPEGINHPKSCPKPDQFYAQMMVDLFTQLSPIPMDEMPEMLRLDHARAEKWGAMTRRIVTAGAVLLQCKNLLKRDVRLPWKTEAHRVMLVLEKAEKDFAKDPAALNSSLVIDGVIAALESGRSMPPATKAQLRTFVERTMAASAVAATARNSPEAGSGDAIPQEPVLRLLLHRLRGYLVARLAAGSSAERTRQTNAAGDRLTGLGLAEFVDRVREMMDEVTRVSEIDRETHGVFWEAVAAHVESEAAASLATSS